MRRVTLRTARVAGLVAGVAVILAILVMGAFGASAASNRARAEAEAAHLLALMKLPAGMRRWATDPTGRHHGLSEPSLDTLTPNLVDAHAWWTTRASASAVLAFVAHHLPHGARRYTFGSSSGGRADTEAETFALPSIRGVMTQILLGVTTVTGLTGKLTSVRTDGEAIWITPRPAWEQIPPGIASVTFTARGANVHGRSGRISLPRTLTAAGARRLVALFNSAEIVQPGVNACGFFGSTSWVRLMFAGEDGETVARATENPNGCGFLSLTIGGRTGPLLADNPTITVDLIRLGAVPVCGGPDLAPSDSLPGRGDDIFDQSISFGFVNGTRVMCELHGFPRIAFFDAQGKRVPITITHLGARITRREGLNAYSVLDPGQGAGFDLTYGACSGAPVATTARVSLPHVARTFVLPVGSTSKPFAPCFGQVGVSNL